jgi:hypothetical protein
VGGAAPAWLSEPAESDDRTWPIHIHGIRTTRITALCSVPIAQELGFGAKRAKLPAPVGRLAEWALGGRLLMFDMEAFD